MTGGQAYARAPEALFRRSLGRVLVRLPEGPLHTLAGTAAEVWELLAPEPTAARIAGELAGRYDAPAAEILADVGALLDRLAAEGLVVPSGGTTTAARGG